MAHRGTGHWFRFGSLCPDSFHMKRALLIAGLWTPVAGTSVALTEVWKMLMLPGDKPLWLMLGTAGAALAMFGPGLWSIDARLYGWEAPGSNNTSQEEF